MSFLVSVHLGVNNIRGVVTAKEGELIDFRVERVSDRGKWGCLKRKSKVFEKCEKSRADMVMKTRPAFHAHPPNRICFPVLLGL